MVELYENGARVDITTSDRDGNFLFLGRQTNQRYEIRIVLGADAEFRQEYEFSAGTPTFVSLNPRYIHSMHPDSKASGLAISLISLSAPKNAQKELEKARELEHKQKLEEALPHLQKAVEAYPQYAEAFNDMGLVHGLLGHAPEAATYYAKAAEADPKWTTPYLNLGQVQLTTGQFDALLKTSQKVEELNPKLETAFYFSGMAFANTKKLEEAERDGLTADQLANGKDPRVHLLLGVVFEARGKVKEAVERYQTYLKMNPGADNAAAVKANVDKLARSLPADKP
jgi:tetratricopeptide (TPR) repeat protein